jgi:hypothetical protein
MRESGVDSHPYYDGTRICSDAADLRGSRPRVRVAERFSSGISHNPQVSASIRQIRVSIVVLGKARKCPFISTPRTYVDSSLALFSFP